MDELAKRRCEPCREGSPAVPEADRPALLAELPGWAIRREDGVDMLSKTYRYPDFVAALGAAGRIGALAEAEDHHPRLVVEYGRLGVTWWTHTIGGLHMNDFVMAARTEALG